MRRIDPGRTLPLVMAGVSFALVVGLAAGPAEEHRPNSSRSAWTVTLTTPESARFLALGHEELAADWYWMMGLQYYGDWKNRSVYWADLHEYLDRTNALDPRFWSPYPFGATAVPYHTGGWVWANVPESTAIIERGLEQRPDSWQLLIQLGFNKGSIGTDRKGAAEAYARAARLPEAPGWLPSLVARLLVTADELESAEDYCRTILAQTTNEEERESLERRLVEIRIERIRRDLQKVVDDYREEHGEYPASLQALVDQGLLESVPEDPLGGEIKLDTNGEVYSTSLWKGVLRVFEERK